MLFQSLLISSLEKVFCRQNLDAEAITAISSGYGEVVSFQIACCAEDNARVAFECESELLPYIKIREVGLVPCELPAMPDDPDILSCEPGIYPDPLYPVNGLFKISRRNWYALWVSVSIPDNLTPGSYPVTFLFNNPDASSSDDYNYFAETQSLSFEVLPFKLPEQQLICTNWFYADCIFTHYKIPCWSDDHWNLLEKYFLNMAQHGLNMLLTPLWTVPLDTAVNHERPTAQLLDIELADGVYKFDFARLQRWIDLALNCGIKYFEMSHAFTQWGASFTPKIIVRENGVEKKLFGWHVAADSPEYRNFLQQLMPPLLDVLRNRGLAGRCYFHVSDEPTDAHLEAYRKAMELFRPLTEDFPIIDALSDLKFFHYGLVSRPVPNTEELDEFMKEAVEQRWVYYAGNYEQVPNRQFGMPSARNRILGLILYLYDLDGFLNWGYNFWYTQYSLQPLDPFKDTNAGRAFCGGGSFMVYPGETGPIDSLHYEIFREGLQDLRALRLLESHIGRDAVVSLIHEGLDYHITIKNYPRESAWLLELRRRINYSLIPK